MFHCFFEQSGTFKNEFKKLGHHAEDYDILNDFNETDHVIDLFKEIQVAYDNLNNVRERERTIFDSINPDQDQIIAFFPCVRFEVQIIMGFRGEMAQMKNWDDETKLEYDLKLHEELHYMYNLITKLALVCLKKKIPLIIENPYTTQHYLTRYWALKPAFIDEDRRETGDYYQKPTQYWFIGRKPSNNFIFESADYKVTKRVIYEKKVDRSMIAPEYANRFIREYVL